MTLLLDESEAISPELLTILLASVKRNNEVKFPDFFPLLFLIYFSLLINILVPGFSASCDKIGGESI